MKTGRITRRIAGVLLAAMMATALATGGQAGAQSDPAPEADEEVVFTIGTQEDILTANPFRAGTASAYEMLVQNYDMLFNFGVDDLSPTSGLAMWPPTHSKDGKTWTFKIREGVTWSDGEPLTAHDIAFTYNFINEKHLAVFTYALGKPIAKDAFEAPDDTTLIWHMEEASLIPETAPYVPIVPEHVWERFSDDHSPNNTNTKEFLNIPAVGSGPFTLTEYEEGQSWTMEANKEYWGGSPTIDKLVFRRFSSQESMALALETGEIDAANGIAPALFNKLKLNSDITTNEAPAYSFDNLAFNFEGTADPSLRNLKVRQAIEASIDKQALVDRVLLGYATVGSSVQLPNYDRYLWQPVGEEIHTFDPSRAKQLLDEAGYKDVDGDGFRETPTGDPWSLEMLAISDFENSVPEAKLEVGWMEDVGIKTTMKVVDTQKGYDLYYKQDYDMYQWGWDGNVDSDFILSIFTTKSCLVWSDGCYSNPAYDGLYEKQAGALDQDIRRDTIIEMQKIIYNDVPEIVLLYPSVLQAFRNDRFTGFINQPAPNGAMFYAWGPAPYVGLKPIAASTEGTADGGGPSWLVLAGIAVLVLGGVFLIAKRRRPGEHVE